MLAEWSSLKIGILGFGVEGQSTHAFLAKQGISSFALFDQNENVSTQGFTTSFLGQDHLSHLQQCDIIIRSAGVSPLKQELRDFVSQGGILTSQVEIFCELYQGEITAVTGTMGKGTCISMLSHVLENNQIEFALGGNIGTPVLDILETAPAHCLLELSSFQLMSFSKPVARSIILNTTSEHLDWHATVAEYRTAKANLVRQQTTEQLCIYYSDSKGACEISEQNQSRQQSFGTEGNLQIQPNGINFKHILYPRKDCKQSAPHQMQNMAAAFLAALDIGLNTNTIWKSLKTFAGLPLRNQWVAEKNGVSFYNDSYATRPEATIAACQSMEQPFQVILGGSEKHADFSELCLTLANNKHLKGISLIGFTAQRLQEELKLAKLHVPQQIFNTLEDAFTHTLSKAEKNSSILMSPACASFGLFPNYKVRGKVFNQLVQAYCESQ